MRSGELFGQYTPIESARKEKKLRIPNSLDGQAPRRESGARICARKDFRGADWKAKEAYGDHKRVVIQVQCC